MVSVLLEFNRTQAPPSTPPGNQPYLEPEDQQQLLLLVFCHLSLLLKSLMGPSCFWTTPAEHDFGAEAAHTASRHGTGVTETLHLHLPSSKLLHIKYHSDTVSKAMAPHSSSLAWKIPWMEEPGGLQSMGSLRVRHDWATSLSLFTFMHWKRKWQPTPVFLPGESQGWGSLVGCRLWGRTELDTTDVT